MTLVKAFPSFTRYLLHRAVAILPSRENCLWDKWDNTPKALKTGSGLFVGATKWVSKTVNKKDMLLPLACWEARIHQHLQSSGSLPYKVSLSFILLQSRLCSGLCSGLSLLCALPPPHLNSWSQYLVPSWTSEPFLLLQAVSMIVLSKTTHFYHQSRLCEERGVGKYKNSFRLLK